MEEEENVKQEVNNLDITQKIQQAMESELNNNKKNERPVMEEQNSNSGELNSETIS